MKNTLTLIIISLFLLSCGNKNSEKSVERTIETNNLQVIIKKRTELLTKKDAIDQALKKINAKIQTLDTTKKIPLITTIISKKINFSHYLKLQGNVTTKKMLVIYPEYSGILTKVYVKEGQKVNKGEILAKIDDGGLSQQLAQLEVQASLSKTTFERQKRLWKQKIGSEIQYLQTKTEYEVQQKAVDQLKQQLKKTIVKAPFSGVIDDVITDQGSVVGAGKSPLLRIVNLNNMYIETEIPEKYITTITKNKVVIVNFPVLDKTLHTKIYQTSNFINPENRTFKAEIYIPNKNHEIKPNLTAKLEINDYTNKNAILIPQSILSENAKGQQYIYIVKNKDNNNQGVAKRIIVQTGYLQGNVIEITKGISVGDEIIDEGARSIIDGQTVKIINQ